MRSKEFSVSGEDKNNGESSPVSVEPNKDEGLSSFNHGSEFDGVEGEPVSQPCKYVGEDAITVAQEFRRAM